jgi:hypothetical protein
MNSRRNFAEKAGFWLLILGMGATGVTRAGDEAGAVPPPPVT